MTTGEDKKPLRRSRVILSQVLACLALDFLLIGLGLSISFVTMVLPEVLDAKEGLSITKKQASWFGSMAFLCQPLGSIFSGPLLDHFGRKKALFLVNIPHVVAWLLMYYAWDVPSLFIGNALLGIGTGIMEAPSVTYIGEISDPSIRGILTTLTNGFTSTGMFVAYLLGTVLPWRQAALVALTVPLATMVLVLFVPETPIWLLSKGRQKEALSSLCRLRGWAKPEDVKEEFDELLKYYEKLNRCVLCAKEGKIVEPCEHYRTNSIKKLILKIKHVFFVKETMKPFLLVIMYFFFYTMSGALPVRPNMVNVCKALGMKYDPKTTVGWRFHLKEIAKRLVDSSRDPRASFYLDQRLSIAVSAASLLDTLPAESVEKEFLQFVVVIGAVFIAMSMLSAIIVKTIGKRKLVIGSMLGTACCSIALSVYARTNVPSTVFSYEMETFTDKKEILPLVLFLMLICFNSLGIPWVLLSEVFPFKSRGIATALAAASSYIIYFGAAKTNYNIEYAFHLSGTFGLYAIFGFIGTVYMYLFLPETEKKTLAEIEAFYKSDRKIFADDFVINAFRKKKLMNGDANKPMLVKSIN